MENKICALSRLALLVMAVSLLAPASGVLTHTDVNPLDPIRFYRVVLLP